MATKPAVGWKPWCTAGVGGPWPVARGHVAIQTNENCFFTVGDEKKNLRLGELWEINNDKKKHSVDNFGNNDRIHLIVDWVQSSLLKSWYPQKKK